MRLVSVGVVQPVVGDQRRNVSFRSFYEAPLISLCGREYIAILPLGIWTGGQGMDRRGQGHGSSEGL